MGELGTGELEMGELATPVLEYGDRGRVRRSTRLVDAGAATVEVELAGVCGTDRHIIDGSLQVPPGTVLGHEIVGRIGRLPDPDLLVADWHPRPGDRVVVAPGVACGTCDNCRRSGVFCRRRKLYGLGGGPGPYGGMSPLMALWPLTRVFRVPDGLPPGRAVFIEPLACAVRAVLTAARAAGPLVGQRLAVFGFGSLGVAVATAAAEFRAQVVVVEPQERRRALARSLGYATAEPPPDPQQPAGAEDGFDVVIECAGVAAAFAAALQAARPGGTVVEMGNFADTGLVGVSPSEICRRGLTVLGIPETDYRDFPVAIDLACRTDVDLPAAVQVVRWSQLDDLNHLFDGSWDPAVATATASATATATATARATATATAAASATASAHAAGAAPVKRAVVMDERGA